MAAAIGEATYGPVGPQARESAPRSSLVFWCRPQNTGEAVVVQWVHDGGHCEFLNSCPYWRLEDS